MGAVRRAIHSLFAISLVFVLGFVSGIVYVRVYIPNHQHNEAYTPPLPVPRSEITGDNPAYGFSDKPGFNDATPRIVDSADDAIIYDSVPTITPLAAVLGAPGIFILSSVRSFLNRISNPVVRDLLGYKNSLLYTNPNSSAEWLFVVVFSWWVWITAARFAWVIPARQFGFYDPASFHKWLWFSIPWRPVYSFWVRRVSRRREEILKAGKTASARFASPWEMMSLVWKPGKLYLGNHRAFSFRFFQPLGIDNDSHICMGAGTGGGKTTLLMTMLALHEGTAFIVDPKGQIAKGMAMRMGKGGNGVEGKGMKVCIYDPKHIVTGYGARARWNPFHEIDRAVERQKMRNKQEILDCLAKGFIPPTPDEQPHPDFAAENFAEKMVNCMALNDSGTVDESFWTDTTKQLLQALILHMYATEKPENCNIARLWELLNNGKPDKAEGKITPFKALLLEMSANPRFPGIVATAANANLDLPGKTEANILGTIRSRLKWLNNSYVQQACSQSTFHLEELRTGKLALFLCAPVTTIGGELLHIFRLLSELALLIFEEYGEWETKTPCLFALDEFPSLGHIPAVERARAVMRSYGLRLLCIFQDIGQLEEKYPNWQGFLSSASAVWWVSVSHQGNREYLEKRLGRRRVNRIVEGKKWYWPFKTRATRVQTEEHAVMTEDQIERLTAPDQGMLIVERRGQRPLKVASAPYFRELPEKFFEADPKHPRPRLRAYTRSILEARAKLKKQ